MNADCAERAQPEWENRILRELMGLAWPIAVSTLSYSIMTLADTLFVSRLGAASIAGVGLAGTTAFLLLCFSFGLLRGIKVLVSQATGAGQERSIPAIAATGVFVGIGFGILSLTISTGVNPLLRLLLPNETAADAATSYFSIRMLSAPILLAFVAMREHRYGLGDSRTPMVANLLGNGLNIGLDYVLIVLLDQGVEGAAWATFAGHSLETAFMVVRRKNASIDLKGASWRHFRRLWEVGCPNGLQFLLEMGSFALLAAMLARLGNIEMAAHQIALQVIHFAFLPAVAIGEAASVLVGQSVGADRDDLVLPVSRLALRVVTAYMAASALTMVIWDENIAACFTADQELSRRLISLLGVAAIFLVFDGVNIGARCILRGTGDVRYPAVVGITTAWLLTPPLTWLLGYHAGLGAVGGWIGLCAELIVCAGILWRRLDRGHWREAAKASRARLPNVSAEVDAESASAAAA